MFQYKLPQHYLLLRIEDFSCTSILKPVICKNRNMSRSITVYDSHEQSLMNQFNKTFQMIFYYVPVKQVIDLILIVDVKMN
jgi:hypothetical protein